MWDFILNAAAAGCGFFFVRVATGYFDAKVSHTTYLEEERSQDLARIVEAVGAVADWGGLYWSRDYEAQDEELEARIVPKMHEIGITCRELFAQDEKSLKAVELEFDRLDDTLTGGLFGGRTKKSDPARAIAVRKDCTDLIQKVRQQRRRLKPIWWTPFKRL